MSRFKFEVAFDGPSLSKHEMDVQELAPALLGFSDLFKAANVEFNGERSAVKLLVRTDVDQHCFNIGLEIVQSAYDTVKDFLGFESVRTAKELLEWLLLLSPCGALGLFKYWAVKNGRRVDNVSVVGKSDKDGVSIVQFNGSAEKYEVHNHIYNLGENVIVADAAEKIFRPLESMGIEKILVRTDGQVATEINAQALAPIKRSYDSVRNRDEELVVSVQVVVAHLRVYAPVFDQRAENWRFVYGGKKIYADISETPIAKEAIRRGGASIGDIYKVKLEITEYITHQKQFRHSYKVKDVLSFEQSPYQMGMLDDLEGDDNAE